MNRQYARTALIAATAIEAIPLTIGMLALFATEGHVGNAIFAGLHVPSVYLLLPLDPVLEYFLVHGLFRVAEAVSLVLVVIVQIGLFATVIYWVLKYRNRKDA